MSWKKEAKSEHTQRLVKSASGASIGLGAGAFPLAGRAGGSSVRTAPNRAASSLCASPIRGWLLCAAGSGARARSHVSYHVRTSEGLGRNWSAPGAGTVISGNPGIFFRARLWSYRAGAACASLRNPGVAASLAGGRLDDWRPDFFIEVAARMLSCEAASLGPDWNARSGMGRDFE